MGRELYGRYRRLQALPAKQWHSTPGAGSHPRNHHKQQAPDASPHLQALLLRCQQRRLALRRRQLAVPRLHRLPVPRRLCPGGRCCRALLGRRALGLGADGLQACLGAELLQLSFQLPLPSCSVRCCLPLVRVSCICRRPQLLHLGPQGRTAVLAGRQLLRERVELRLQLLPLLLPALLRGAVLGLQLGQLGLQASRGATRCGLSPCRQMHLPS